ncbi:hypothetical protein C4580_05070 [Candidatus Woesearchaeota archaeon]|nr:MAG: hypothetical protein C4580_05070 [Candidatus Woesearchaeota archaeon]
MRNKKAALELSITAIVVLIIAITVLGLGIGFIKKQFGAGTELVSKELSNIKEQIRDQVRTGGDLLVFPPPEQVSIGRPEGTFVGVRNTAANPDGDRVCFRVEVRCLQPFTPGGECVRGQPGPVAVGGYDFERQGYVSQVNSEANWFTSLLAQFDLKNYEGDVYDAVMQVRNVRPDTYSMEINIYKAKGDQACSAAPEFESYASKTFVLKVV